MVSKENSLVRRLTGQLSWISSQTRPDLSFEAFHLSTKLSKATHRDALDANKAAKKAMNRNPKLIFGKLGKISNLHIELFPDAALGNVEENLKTKSMMGYFICLSNDSFQISPLHWKSKVIEKVAPDIKSAETALDEAIHMGNMLSEIYFDDPHFHKIPIRINENSKSLVQSIFSTEKVQRKAMMVVVSKIQEHLTS